MDRSLSFDSTKVVDIPFEEYEEYPPGEEVECEKHGNTKVTRHSRIF